MFLPLRVEYDYDRKPWATWGLIAFNVLCFVLTFSAPDSVIEPLMLWPDRFAPWQWWTSGFLHAGFLHLGGNMLFLWVYGRYVEERLGVARYLALYAILAPLESLAFVLINWGSEIPAVGASGVISGMMGVVMAVAPGSRVKTFLWWGPIFRVVPIHAGLILGLWVVEQAAMAALGAQGIAISSHLGGFAGGLAIGLLLRSERMRESSWYISPMEQSREDVEMKLRSQYYGALAEYHRGKRTSHVGNNEIPDWLKPDDEPEIVDPYEQAQLERWKRG